MEPLSQQDNKISSAGGETSSRNTFGAHLAGVSPPQPPQPARQHGCHEAACEKKFARHRQLDDSWPGSESDYLISGRELAQASRRSSRRSNNSNSGNSSRSNKEPVCHHCQRAVPRANLLQSGASGQPGGMMKGAKPMEKYAGSIRSIGFLLFLAASLFCLYKIYQLNESDETTNHFPASHTTRLKLVSVFNRHGDRSPSDSLPDVDPHKQRTDWFWPNGFSNLTETGKLREFRIGLELRRRYDRYLDYNASHFLALSSPIARCQESIWQTLRGLFDIETTAERGRWLVERYNAERGASKSFCFKEDDLVHNETFCSQQSSQRSASPTSPPPPPPPAGSRSEKSGAARSVLPSGSGLPLEYEKVAVDLKAVPSLTYEYLTDCKWRQDHPTPVDEDLLNSPAVAQLKGIKKLAKLIKTRYNLDLNFTTLGLWSGIHNELVLARTRETIGYTEHFLDWLDTPLPEYKSVRVSLFDLWEQVSVLAYRDRIVDTANLIQFGPMLSSLLKSYEVALAEQPTGTGSSSSSNSARMSDNYHGQNSIATGEQGKKELKHESAGGTFVDANLYRDKKMIIYSTHDSIVQQMMMNLNVIRFEPNDFETRWAKWRRSTDVDQLLAGLKMSKFGLSLAFELYETELNSKTGPPPPPAGSTAPAPAKCEKEPCETANTKKKKRFPFIQAVLYNQADAKYKPVEYQRIKLGAACRHKFKAMHEALPRAEVESMLAHFYDPEFPIERDLSCPYELFKRVTSDFMIQPDELNKLCAH